VNPLLLLALGIAAWFLADKTLGDSALPVGGTSDPLPPANPGATNSGPSVPSGGDSSTFLAAYVASPYHGIISAQEAANNIPPNMLAALLYQESRFNPNAIGPATQYGTAKGIAQFIDSTAQSLGIDAMDPDSAIPGAARYLASLAKQIGDWTMALAAYNWGIGNVQSGNPLPDETQNYIDAITENSGYTGADVSETDA
jgi:soluble lytic murein transglycosylase-like protein